MYNLSAFTRENFAESLKNEFTPVSEITSKRHFDYLFGYLSSLGAKTIVIEKEYISKDYLHDYSTYYSFCFEQYPKVCKRVHFFQLTFDETALDQLISEGYYPHLSIRESYLGFIVVKPIPNTVIGLTVLKTYDNSSSNFSFDARNFWGARKYSVNLFGISLEVATSLAFQEQDSVVSACATAAIWSMLHGAIKNANHSITLKTPVEITRDAGHASDGNRVFPNHGLEIRQIGEAIIKSGLVCEIKSVENNKDWLSDEYEEDENGNRNGFESVNATKAKEEEVAAREIDEEDKNERIPKEYIQKLLNAYSGIGIPIILIVSVSDQGVHDYHAITVTGFIKKKPAAIPPKPQMSFLASNIVKFYAHDDQWGPFVRVQFLDDNLLSTTWSEIDGSEVAVNAIIIPVFPKIRITYSDIEPLVRAYDTVLTLILNELIKEDLVWDIKLIMNQDYKEQLKTDLNPPRDYPEKLGILTRSLPRYLWTATCYISEIKFLELAFDATSVGQAMHGLFVISHMNDELKNHIVDTLSKSRGEEAFQIFEHDSGQQYFDFLLNELKR